MPTGTVTVTFDSAGGSAVPQMELKKGATIGMGAVSTRAHADFDGWYLGTERWDPSSPVQEDVTLVARWIPHSTEGLCFVATQGGYEVSAYTGTSKEVVIPFEHDGQPVVSVAQGAFNGALDLTALVLPASVESVGTELLGLTSLVNLELPAHLITSVGQNAGTLERVIINGGTEIPAGAFMGCGVLDVVEMPNTITKIGNGAFSSCFCLTSIYIPAGVTEIGVGAFSDCMKLVEVKNDSATPVSVMTPSESGLGEYALNVYSSTSGTSKLTVVDEYVFIDADDATYLVSYRGHDTTLNLPQIGRPYKLHNRSFFNTGAFTSVVMPEGVTEIGYEAFYGCGHILHFSFPRSLNYIAYSAIFNCAYVESATYAGTVSEWNAMEKHAMWNLHAYSFPIYCTDGTTYSR